MYFLSANVNSIPLLQIRITRNTYQGEIYFQTEDNLLNIIKLLVLKTKVLLREKQIIEKFNLILIQKLCLLL